MNIRNFLILPVILPLAFCAPLRADDGETLSQKRQAVIALVNSMSEDQLDAVLMSLTLVTRAMTQDSSEKSSLTNLDVLRSAVKVYRTDNNDTPPAKLEDVIPKILTDIPSTNLPSQERNAKIIPVDSLPKGKTACDIADGTGGFLYISDKSSADYGKVFINSRALDLLGMKKYCEY